MSNFNERRKEMRIVSEGIRLIMRREGKIPK
jgi:hypothetical protein